jgi:hypothetical protein
VDIGVVVIQLACSVFKKVLTCSRLETKWFFIVLLCALDSFGYVMMQDVGVLGEHCTIPTRTTEETSQTLTF